MRLKASGLAFSVVERMAMASVNRLQAVHMCTSKKLPAKVDKTTKMVPAGV